MLCPEDWRRRYILGEKTAPTGSMFLGRQVDDAINLYDRHILDHGEHLTLDQIKDAFWDGWKAAAEAEREQLGIACETDLREDNAFKLGLDAVELTVSELIPHLGEPVAVQRKVEYTLAPGLERSALCYLDLETVQHNIGEERGAEHHQILDSFEGVRAAESTVATQLGEITGQVAESKDDAGYAATAARLRVAAGVFGS